MICACDTTSRFNLIICIYRQCHQQNYKSYLQYCYVCYESSVLVLLKIFFKVSNPQATEERNREYISTLDTTNQGKMADEFIVHSHCPFKLFIFNYLKFASSLI